MLGDTDKCEDIDQHCPEWVSNNECATRPDYMAQNCKKSCEMCGPGELLLTIQRCFFNIVILAGSLQNGNKSVNNFFFAKKIIEHSFQNNNKNHVFYPLKNYKTGVWERFPGVWLIVLYFIHNKKKVFSFNMFKLFVFWGIRIRSVAPRNILRPMKYWMAF